MKLLSNKFIKQLSPYFILIALALLAIGETGEDVVKFIFIFGILVLFSRQWNQTNKILEDLKKHVEDIANK